MLYYTLLIFLMICEMMHCLPATGMVMLSVATTVRFPEHIYFRAVKVDVITKAYFVPTGKGADIQYA